MPFSHHVNVISVPKDYILFSNINTVNKQKIIDAIKSNPKVTQEELAEIVGITRKSVISNMKKLQENGLINRIGADKNGYWKVVE